MADSLFAPRESITLAQYWMDRDRLFARFLTPEIRANAAALLPRVNRLLAAYYQQNPEASAAAVNSGWRPPVVNAGTRDAAASSNHLTGHAVDLRDDDDALDQWITANPHILPAVGLYREHPSATRRWCHLQDVPPRSGNRTYYP